MTVGLSDRLRKVSRTAFVATGVAVATFQLSGSLGLRINTSPSLPMGLYVTTADAGANLVEFCPVEPFATLSAIFLSITPIRSINSHGKDPSTKNSACLRLRTIRSFQFVAAIAFQSRLSSCCKSLKN